MARRFSWNAVDERLVRKLLTTFYDQRSMSEDVGVVRGLDVPQLRREAARILGRPPKSAYHKELTDVLLRTWLPTCDPVVVEELTGLVKLRLGAAERSRAGATKAQRVQFLQSRNKTDNLVRNVWAVFTRAHTEQSGELGANSSVARVRSRARIELVGVGDQPRFDPYDHQKQAWKQLDDLRRARGRRSGLIVIPTGGGKTATMVDWLVKEMQRRRELRVLWIADQQELVDQAAREFERLARTAPDSFRRLLRAAHASAGSISAALGDGDIDVLCTTRQSLVGRTLDRKQKASIKLFVSRPTVVVIDEAHHAVSPSYQALIEFLWGVGKGMMLVGLTATPWPAGAGRTAQLRTSFARELVSVTTGALVSSGDLARPVVHTIATEERIEATEEDLRKLAGRDVPPRVARQLDRRSRNSLVVDQWVDRQVEWGKTLVFACDIAHADSLGAAFRDRGVDVDVLHSTAEVDRSRVLDEFRQPGRPRVLVSVGMLLEGVDIPSARTAFLCRPTGSRIVMRQMIGRVLRGIRAGGDADAHIVDFVDQWSAQAAILSPVDIPHVPVVSTKSGEGAAEHAVPRVVADDGETEIATDLLRSIELAMAERVRLSGLNATLTSSRLVGFYDLDVRRLPVFAAAREAWEDASRWALDPKDKRGTSAKTFFDEVPPPTPMGDELDAFVDYCGSNLLSPPFVELHATVDVAASAQRLIDAGPLTEEERITRLRRDYEATLTGTLFPTLHSFIEAVEQEKLARLKVIPSGARPENVPIPDVPPADRLRRAQRALAPLASGAVAEGRLLLSAESEYQELLDDASLPDIDWSQREMRAMWAYWSWRTATRVRGKPLIRINKVLRAPKSQISDELLKYLIWHELCHHLTPGQGHDSEFRRLEALWPSHARLDHELDTLYEKWDVSPQAKR